MSIEPKVEVRIPKVTLRFDELAYLKSLANGDEVQCKLSSTREAKLAYLGLIQLKKLPPPPKQVAERARQCEDMRKQFKAAAQREDWKFIDQNHWEFKRLQTALEEKERMVITCAGKALLGKGEVVVKISKKGCP